MGNNLHGQHIHKNTVKIYIYALMPYTLRP